MDRELVGEYIQFPKIAKDFANYLELYYKYRDDYQVEQVLEGHISEAAVDKLQRASFDERISVVSLLLSGLNEKFRNVIRMEEMMSLRMEQMKKLQAASGSALADALSALAENFHAGVVSPSGKQSLIPGAASHLPCGKVPNWKRT